MSGRQTIRRAVLYASLLGLLGAGGWLAHLYGPVVAALRMPVLPSADAEATRTGMRCTFHLPETAGPTLFRLGPPPTPAGITHSTENPSAVCVFLFESFGDLTVVTLDKASMSFRETSVPGSKLTYNTVWDRADPQRLWVATCLGAGLWRYDLGTGAVEPVCRVEGESHVFGLDQLDDGTLVLGTHPNARCFRVRPPHPALSPGGERVGVRGADLQEIAIDPSLVSGCTYLHDVFAAGKRLLLHYGSPGVLVRHDLDSGRSEVLHRSKHPFLGFTASADGLAVTDDGLEWYFNRRGERVARPPAVPAPGYRLGRDNDGGRITCGGRTATFSLAPRQGGMAVTAFGAGKDGKVYGGTYWNTWMFVAGGDPVELRGVGPLPGGCGEFFSHGWVGGKLAIPSYQGALYLYDPAWPYDAGNPAAVAQMPEAHFGLACATNCLDELFYATAPNYHQAGGMLVRFLKGGGCRAWEEIGDHLTFGSLAFVGDTLCGGTVQVRGMGLTSGKAAPGVPRVVAVSEERQQVLASVPLGKERGDVRALLPLSPSELLAATPRGLYVVSRRGEGLRAKAVSRLPLYRRVCRCEIHGLVDWKPGLVLVNAAPFLFAYDVGRREVTPLCRLPVKAGRAALDKEGDLFLATEDCVYCLPARALDALSARAGLNARRKEQVR